MENDPNIEKKKYEESENLPIGDNDLSNLKTTSNNQNENENLELTDGRDKKITSPTNQEIRERKSNSSDSNDGSDGSDGSDIDDSYETNEKLAKQLKKKTFFLLIIINIIAFIASFSYWNQKGVLPYLTRKLGVDPRTFGYLESTFAIYQMVGSPIFGRCGDVFGARVVMIISEIASSICYGSLYFVNIIPLLFLSRVPAFFMHNLQGSYMIITDITLPKDRANMLGKLGVSHGLGMLVGSFVGGVVTDNFNEETATLVAACGNLVAVVFIFIFIPDDTKTIRRQLEIIDQKTNQTSDIIINSTNENTPSLGFKQICTILKIDLVKYLLFIKILSAFPFSILYSMFTIAIMDYYHLGPYYNGLILAYVGTLGIFVQGCLIGFFTKHFSHPDLVKYAIFLKVATFLLIVVAENIFVFCVLLLPLTIGGLTSHIVLLASLTKVVCIEDTGTILGVTLALHAVVRSIAPTVGGLLFVNVGWPFFGVIGYVVHLFLAGFIVINEKQGY